MYAFIVKVFAKPDVRLLSIHLSPQLIAPGLVFEFLFDCHAKPSQPRAHPCASAALGPGDPVRNLLLKGHWSGTASLSSRSHRVYFDWTISYLQAALLLKPLLHIIHPVTDETLSCGCVLKMLLLLMIQMSTWFLSLLHICQVCVNWCLTHSKACNIKWRLPLEANC